MTIEERLKKFEKELSRYRRLLAVVTLGIGVCVATWIFSPQMLLAQPATEPFKEVRAMSFVLLDENDNTRAVLGFEKTGRASLRFIDGNGKIRFGIFVDEDESGLAILDKSGKVRVDIGVNDDDESRLALSQGSSKPRFVISERKDHSLMLIMIDERQTTRAVLGLDKDGPVLSMFDERETTRAVLRVDKDGPVLALYGKNGQVSVGLGVDKDEVSRIVMVDKDGKALWSAP